MQLPGLDRLQRVGLVGERKALSLLCLGFYTTLFFMITLSARTELPEWLPVFVAMTLVYTTAFMAVAAEWFWGRWFATGLGYWGCTMAMMAFVTTRSFPPAMIIFGGMHALISGCLFGEKMAAVFDAKPNWRARWKLDDQGVMRVRKSVTRMASSLPALIMFALAPREGQEMFGLPVFDVSAVALLGLAVFAMFALLASRRTWAVLALGSVGVVTLGKALFAEGRLWSAHTYLDPAALPHASCYAQLLGVFAGVLLLASTAPFLAPIGRYLLRGRR